MVYYEVPVLVMSELGACRCSNTRHVGSEWEFRKKWDHDLTEQLKNGGLNFSRC